MSFINVHLKQTAALWGSSRPLKQFDHDRWSISRWIVDSIRGINKPASWLLKWKALTGLRRKAPLPVWHLLNPAPRHPPALNHWACRAQGGILEGDPIFPGELLAIHSGPIWSQELGREKPPRGRGSPNLGLAGAYSLPWQKAPIRIALQSTLLKHSRTNSCCRKKL